MPMTVSWNLNHCSLWSASPFLVCFFLISSVALSKLCRRSLPVVPGFACATFASNGVPVDHCSSSAGDSKVGGQGGER